MVIDGRRYSSDLIIYPDGRVEDNWWRASGHDLVAADMTELIEAGPARIIVGTGASGIMRLSEDVRAVLENEGIAFEAMPTGEAVAAYNRVSAGGNVGACFHLTC